MLETVTSLTHDKLFILFDYLTNIDLVNSFTAAGLSFPRSDDLCIGAPGQLFDTFFEDCSVRRKILLLDDKSGGLGCNRFALVEPRFRRQKDKSDNKQAENDVNRGFAAIVPKDEILKRTHVNQRMKPHLLFIHDMPVAHSDRS